MTWTREDPAPNPSPRWRLQVGGSLVGADLLLTEATNHTKAAPVTMRHLTVSVCGQKGQTIEEAKQQWPAEAIAEARRLLDELETETKGHPDV